MRTAHKTIRTWAYPSLYNRALSIAAAALIVIAGTSESRAQYGTTTNSGLFGSRTLGGNVTGGNRSLTGSPGNQGGVGQGFGGQNFGGGLGGGGLGGGGMGAAGNGQVSGNERFVRGSRQGQFVGRDMADMNNFVGQAGNSSAIGNQGFGLERLAGALQAANVNQAGNVQRSPVPVAYNVAFPYRGISAAQLVPAINKRMELRFPATARSFVRLVMEDRALVLTGVVSTEHERALAQQLVALEPGIGQIRNELVVDPFAAGEPVPPPEPDAAPR